MNNKESVCFDDEVELKLSEADDAATVDQRRYQVNEVFDRVRTRFIDN